MSFVILIANIVTSQYTTLYMVHDAKMGQAEAGGEKFEGVAADLSRERFKAGIGQITGPVTSFTILTAVLAFSAPYCIIAGLTKFQPANTTRAQNNGLVGFESSLRIYVWMDCG